MSYSGWLRTESVEGYAGLWLRVDNADGTSYLDNMSDRGVAGTTNWQRYEITVEVPDNADHLAFGALLVGEGEAWVDELSLTMGHGDEPESLYALLARAHCARYGFLPKQNQLDWLADQLIPIETSEPRADVTDLMPLIGSIGDSRVVALGEATHGTREFFDLKHRLVRFLAEEMGFSIFAIEASMPEAYRLNDFVLTGEGDPAELLEGMHFWTWNTQEVLDMILWMREYNASGAGVMQFTGFDMQFPDLALEEVEDFLRRADLRAFASLKPLLERLREAIDAYRAGNEYRASDWHEEAWILYGHLREYRDEYIARLGEAESAWAMQNSRIVLQGAQSATGARTRDQSMAANVQWIMRQNPGQKIVVWAHNAHVSESETRFLSMGRLLSNELGTDYLSVGFVFYQGRYTALRRGPEGLCVNEVLPAFGDSLGGVFHLLGHPLFALDLRTVTRSPVAPLLAEPFDVRMIGAVAIDGTNAYHSMVLADEYDMVLFVDEMHPSTLLK